MSISRLIKSIFCYLIIIITAVIAGLFWLTANDRAIDYEVSTEGVDIPTFDEQIIDFVPTYDKNLTLPFTAGAVIDINGDGIEELFFGGGIHQADAFYQFIDGKFQDITESTE